METEQILRLKEMIDQSQNIVFFGGAGVSTESGIPDFRSVDGLYHQQYPHPPEVMLSHSFFHSHTEEFYDFYKNKLIHPNAKPNFAHEYLVELEQEGKLRGIVTQNIDNLHHLAGSQRVYELHGSVQRNHCLSCQKPYSLEQLMSLPNPHCSCGGLIKPDVVLYEEGLPEDTVAEAISAIEEADLLIVAGTSLAVYPAASFVGCFKGKHLVVINKTPLSLTCELHIQGAVGEVFRQVKEAL